MNSSVWPSQSIAEQILSRLCENDPIASSDLANAFLHPLAEWLLRTNRQVDPHLCEEAAGDAIIELIKNPRAYDPERRTLAGYLCMSAKGDLLNLLEKESRHRSRRADFAVVELYGSGRNAEMDAAQESALNDQEETDRDVEETMMSMAPGVLDSFSSSERLAFDLLIQGERRTRAFASVLGVGHLSESEQWREVKRVKDRIKQRVRRARSQT